MFRSLIVLGFSGLIVGCGQSVTINSEKVPPTTTPVVVEAVPEPVVAVQIEEVEIGIEEVEVEIEEVEVEEIQEAPDYGPILGRAIQGYDPVAYFNDGPTEGRADLHVTHNGATYYFSSEANREEFYANPTRYEPAYGGFCAYAIGINGDLVEVNPKTFKIIDGKLNLFYNKNLINTLSLWNLNEDKLKSQAAVTWSEIVAEGRDQVNTQ